MIYFCGVFWGLGGLPGPTLPFPGEVDLTLLGGSIPPVLIGSQQGGNGSALCFDFGRIGVVP